MSTSQPPQHIIFIHGLMGSPHEWNEAAAMFQKMGVKTHQICLPGHGDNPDEAIKKYTLEDLYQYCLAEYKKCSNNEPALIIGHSLGAALATLLAADNQELSGLILMGCPFDTSAYTHPWGLWQHPRGVFKQGKHYLKDSLTGFKRPKTTTRDFWRFFIEGRQLFKKVQSATATIKCPVWIFHSQYDLHVPFNNMQNLANALRHSPQVQQYSLTQCGHQIFPKSNEKEAVLSQLESIWQDLTPKKIK